MAKFYPIYIRRSDGKLAVYSKDNKSEPNEPTAKQLDQTPDKNGVADYYTELASGEIRNLEWRRKLGGMLAREMKVKDKSGYDAGYILVSFPENYRLYEHVKKSIKDNKDEKIKSHAGGGNDRQDAYLYGHPNGRKKRYRSPADFFPHLLWLCTDEAGDPNNCTCKVCCPEELDNIAAAVLKATKPSESDTKPTKSVTQPQPAPSSLSPSPLPQPVTKDQQEDSHYGRFKYRQGEMCWFRRGQAWGLGVILRRWQQQSTVSYTIQPLSYPQNKHVPVTLNSDDDMRPWLAWSVPKYTHAGLNNLMPPPQYDTLDWQAVAQGHYGAGDLDVDASILAAKSIDCSYTPFHLGRQTTVQAGIVDCHYDGAYIGAEKIWKGEAVRLAMGTGIDIMVVHDIVERTSNTKIEPLQLVGDVYALTRVSHVDPRVPTPAAPEYNTHLPPRLTQDLAFRNARSIQVRQIAHHWKLTNTQARIDINNVRGRWYEASLWLPVLQPEAYRRMNEAGDIQELSLHLNSRGDCLAANREPNAPRIPRYNLRRSTRLAAMSQAVPAGTLITDGSGAPSNDVGSSMDTNMEVSHGEVNHSISSGSHNDNKDNLDQFMNLDASHDNYY